MDLLTSAENLCFRACSHYSIELPVVRLVLLGLVWSNGILLSEKSLLCACYILYAFRNSRLLNWRQLKGIEDSYRCSSSYSLSRLKGVDFYCFQKGELPPASSSDDTHQQQRGTPPHGRSRAPALPLLLSY